MAEGSRRIQKFWEFLARPLGIWLFLLAGGGVLCLAWWLRRFPIAPDPLLYGELQFTSGILAIVFATSALVRFRGTRKRLPLTLAIGISLVGITLASTGLASLHLWETVPSASLRDPMTWVIPRTLLAVLLVVALVVERRIPTARSPRREMTVMIVVVVAAASLLSTVHWQLPTDYVVHPDGVFPRPGNLFPAALFLLATFGYFRRLRGNPSPFDRSLYLAAGLNVACCLAASESVGVLDAPFFLAGILQFASYATLVSGALLDNIQLFEGIRELAMLDPLTGLANYRRLVSALEIEIQRTDRSDRPFALLMFDLDGLKRINDQYGHVVGSRALCRVANVLRYHSRTIDTAARYGGDEFALVLPETGLAGAQEVARRIGERLAADPEPPPISVSAGVAVYPQDGPAIQALFNAADEDMYRAKRRSTRESSLVKTAHAR